MYVRSCLMVYNTIYLNFSRKKEHCYSSSSKKCSNKMERKTIFPLHCHCFLSHTHAQRIFLKKYCTMQLLFFVFWLYRYRPFTISSFNVLLLNHFAFDAHVYIHNFSTFYDIFFSLFIPFCYISWKFPRIRTLACHTIKIQRNYSCHHTNLLCFTFNSFF